MISPPSLPRLAVLISWVKSYGPVVSLLAAGLRSDLVRSLVAIEPPAFGVAKDDDVAAATAMALRFLFAQASVMTTAEFFAAFLKARGRSSEDIQKQAAKLTPKDWAAVDSSRRERDPIDAPIPFQVLRQAAFPKCWCAVPGSRSAFLAAKRLAGHTRPSAKQSPEPSVPRL